MAPEISSPVVGTVEQARPAAAVRAMYLALAAILIVGVFLTLVQRVWGTTVDDTFITLRYARNLAQGYGPTWNTDGVPVEGYTTLLWMLLLALPHVLQLDALIFAKVVGVACTLATFGLVAWAILRVSARPGDRGVAFAAVSAVGFMAVFAPTTIHAITGMETALFTCLLTGFFVATAVLAERPSRQMAQCVALLGLLVGLTRPEGNVAVLVTGALAVWLLPRGNRRELLLSLGLLYVLPGVAYMTWRIWYYGALLPLPFLVKAVHQESLAGLGSVLDFARYLLPRLGVLWLLAAFRLRRLWVPALMGALAFGCFWIFPAHIMGYNWRFLFPLVPLLLIIAAHGLLVLTHASAQVLRRRGAVLRWLPALVAALMPLATVAIDIPSSLEAPVAEGRGLAAAHLRLGHELAAFRANAGGDPLLAIGDAGAAPYYSGWRTLDHFGLNTPAIARSGTHDPAYVLDQRPDVLVLISASATTFASPLAYEMELHTAAAARGMIVAQVLTYLPNHHYLWVLVEPGTPIAAYLAGLPR